MRANFPVANGSASPGLSSGRLFVRIAVVEEPSVDESTGMIELRWILPVDWSGTQLSVMDIQSRASSISRLQNFRRRFRLLVGSLANIAHNAGNPSLADKVQCWDFGGFGGYSDGTCSAVG
jgi:hypothetical protein